MKYLKTFEKTSLIFYGDNEKSPDGFKFNIGDYVKFSGKIPTSWKDNDTKFDNDAICVIIVVNKNDPYEYCIVPYNAPNSSYETWESDDDLELASEEEIAAIKYNL